MKYNLVYNHNVPLFTTLDEKDGHRFDEQIASSIQKTIYFLLKKRMAGEDIGEERYKKQFGNIYYRNMTAIDIVESETHHPLSQNVSFANALDLALYYYSLFDEKAFHPLIIDTRVQTKIGSYIIEGDVHVIGELRNRRRGRNIECIYFTDNKLKPGYKDSYFTRNNLWLNFGSHVIRQELNATEDLSTLYSLAGQEKHTVTRIDDESYYRFISLVQYTCDQIMNNQYPVFVTRRKCNGCKIKNICENYKISRKGK